MENIKLNSVQEFYKDKIIFITGPSGFMGKVLVEKLLYSCSDLKELVLLMRPKRGQGTMMRIKEFEKLPIFERIMKEKPEVMKKIRVVTGDIFQTNLGMVDEDFRYVTENTQIVFHLAASLKLEATLKPNIEANLTATRRILNIGKQMKNLIAMLYASTAFSIPEEKVVEERIYEFDHDPNDLIKCSEWMSEKAMEKLQPEILGVQPNTYTYSKRLAEILVNNEYKNNNFPVFIVRPSVVAPAYHEPKVGWVDTFNGPGGFIAAASKGVLRIARGDFNGKFNMIPVDYAINGFILAAKQFGVTKERPKEIPIYNMTSHDNAAPPYRVLYDTIYSVRWEIPCEVMLWYPNTTITMNEYFYWIGTFLFQWIPAVLIDFLFMIFRQKRFMIKIQKMLYVGIEAIRWFSVNSWVFKMDNFNGLMKYQSKEEYEMFNIDTEKIDIIDFYRKAITGGRVYLLKDPLSTIPRGKTLMAFLLILDLFVKGLFFYWLFKKILIVTGIMDPLADFIGNIRS